MSTKATLELFLLYAIGLAPLIWWGFHEKRKELERRERCQCRRCMEAKEHAKSAQK